MRDRAYVFCLMVLIVQHCCGQFVTLQGDRFKVDGHDFYPIVMNYEFDLLSQVAGTGPTDPNDVFVSMTSWYGPQSLFWFECQNAQDCRDDLLEHFSKIADAGFNTIRIAGFATPSMKIVGSTRNYMATIRAISTVVWSNDRPLDLWTFNGPWSMMVFRELRVILDLAEQAGLKAILLCAEDTPSLYPTLDPNAVDLYEAWLGRLAFELKDHPALMAYDLWNEPIWSVDNQEMMDHTKEEICNMTTQWYDAIHNNDPNHLVTLGGWNIDELHVWDPAVMKLDFYSPHVYPRHEFINDYSPSSVYSRAEAEIYWLGADRPMPFLIGETAFSAEDDASHIVAGAQFLDPDPQYHRYPFMHGSETEQSQYAQSTMEHVRNYLGSGYSWWGMQNIHKQGFNGDLNLDQGGYRENFWGIHNFGDPATDPNADKPVATMFSNFTLPSYPTSLPNAPSAYGDWQFLGGSVAHSGDVEDQNGAPVSHAIFTVQWNYEDIINPNDIAGFNALYSSNALGQYEFITPPTIAGYDPPYIWSTRITASGAESLSWSVGTLPPATVSLARQRLPFEKLIDYTLVDAGNVREYKAWALLTLDHVSVLGGGTMTSRAREIQVDHEFLAESGSEVHLKAEKTFSDCSNLAYRSFTNNAPSGLSYIPAIIKDTPEPVALKLQFQSAEQAVQLYPNPCRSKLFIQATKQIDQVTIHDLAGKKILSVAPHLNQLSINTEGFSSGEYYLMIKSNGTSEVLQFTKLP